MKSGEVLRLMTIAYSFALRCRRSRRAFLLTTLQLSLAFASGCLDPSRFNTRCEWTGDSAFAIDMNDRAHRAHLKADVRTAEENAIRYGDGLIRRQRLGLEPWVPITFGCLDSLYRKIESAHGVTRATIKAAAGMRDWGTDTLLIWLPSALLLIVGSRSLIQRILRRSSPSESHWAALLMLVWLGLGVSAVSVGTAHLWGWAVEEWRLRTHHLSFRARYLPVGMYVWQAYATALFLFAIVAAHGFRASMRRQTALPPRRSIDAWKR
jgi:hypothetical protein